MTVFDIYGRAANVTSGITEVTAKTPNSTADVPLYAMGAAGSVWLLVLLTLTHMVHGRFKTDKPHEYHSMGPGQVFGIGSTGQPKRRSRRSRSAASNVSGLTGVNDTKPMEGGLMESNVKMDGDAWFKILGMNVAVVMGGVVAFMVAVWQQYYVQVNAAYDDIFAPANGPSSLYDTFAVVMSAFGALYIFVMKATQMYLTGSYPGTDMQVRKESFVRRYATATGVNTVLVVLITVSYFIFSLQHVRKTSNVNNIGRGRQVLVMVAGITLAALYPAYALVHHFANGGSYAPVSPVSEKNWVVHALQSSFYGDNNGWITHADGKRKFFEGATPLFGISVYVLFPSFVYQMLVGLFIWPNAAQYGTYVLGCLFTPALMTMLSRKRGLYWTYQLIAYFWFFVITRTWAFSFDPAYAVMMLKPDNPDFTEYAVAFDILIGVTLASLVYPVMSTGYLLFNVWIESRKSSAGS